MNFYNSVISSRPTWWCHRLTWTGWGFHSGARSTRSPHSSCARRPPEWRNSASCSVCGSPTARSYWSTNMKQMLWNAHFELPWRHTHRSVKRWSSFCEAGVWKDTWWLWNPADQTPDVKWQIWKSNTDLPQEQLQGGSWSVTLLVCPQVPLDRLIGWPTSHLRSANQIPSTWHLHRQETSTTGICENHECAFEIRSFANCSIWEAPRRTSLSRRSSSGRCRRSCSRTDDRASMQRISRSSRVGRAPDSRRYHSSSFHPAAKK